MAIERLGRLPLAAALCIGAAGLLILGAQPLLYGLLVGEGRIPEARIGLLATTEILAIALGSAAGVPLLRRFAPWLIVLAGSVLLAGGNLGTAPPVGLPLLLLARAIAGFGGGMLVAIAAVAIARGTAVTTASAAFLLLQATSQFTVMEWFARGQAPEIGPVTTLLAASALLILPLLALVPRRLSPPRPADPSAERSPIPAAGLSALVAAALFVGSIVGIWAYLGVWLAETGRAQSDVAALLTASLGGQMLGALVAMLVGERGRSGERILVLGLALLGLVGFLLAGGSASHHGVLVTAFGFVWMLATPLFGGFIVDADPERRALPFAASAQLTGAALMPTLSGELFGGHGMDSVILFNAGGVCISIIAVLATMLLRRRA